MGTHDVAGSGWGLASARCGVEEAGGGWCGTAAQSGDRGGPLGVWYGEVVARGPADGPLLWADPRAQ
jgi:hypothetical protein